MSECWSFEVVNYFSLPQECKGVDLNRNFGYHWGGYGASNDPCKETFRGSGAFSEPESQAIKNFLLSGEANFQLYLTFHSYGQYLLYPWGYGMFKIRYLCDRNCYNEWHNAFKSMAMTMFITSLQTSWTPGTGRTSREWATLPTMQ